MVDNVEAVMAGIDWLTMTLPRERATGELWQEHCLGVLDKIAEGGYELKYRTLQGYYGVSAGNNFVGQRDDGFMVQLTGSHANDHLSEVFRSDAHYSRIDVQSTIRYRSMPDDIATRAYEAGIRDNKRLSPARRRKLLLLTGSDGGDTCYIGSPSSEQQCRIYNKERQSEDIKYARAWRYEVVYRNNLATRLAQTMPLNVLERARWAENVVYSWLASRGINELLPDPGGNVVIPIIRTLPTDVERQLAWVKRQVIPVVKRLIECGYADDIRELLAGSGVFRQD